MKKFELSAYGVEEMESQEMKSVDGGVIGWAIAGVLIAAASLAVAIYEICKSPKTQAPSPSYPGEIMRADSIRVYPDGSMMIYGPQY